jgi:RimJ/RimL family protein N-acetyltransferase
MSTDTMEVTATTREPGYTGQTFLVGEQVYLRGIEEADAKLSVSWRPTIFPISTELTEEWIKDEFAKEDNPTYGIVRKADDRIVGSIKIDENGLDYWINAKVDPLLGDAGLMAKAEAITLVADWLVNERGQAIVHYSGRADEQVVIDRIEAFGMRQTARFRQHVVTDKGRVDKLFHEYTGPKWVANLGDPNDIPLERTGTGEPRPVPPPVVLDGDPPRNAVMVGSRVYLRPEEPDDAELAALRSRQETETWFDIGRHMTSSAQYRDWIKSHEKKDPPAWITFAVCLREDDKVIGWVALLDVDYQNRFAETGSFFGDPAYRGGGYGSEAKQLLLEYAFERLGLHVLHSWVYFPNTRSAAALRKQGYREAGQINWLYSHQGGMDNMVVFDLLAEEWRAMPRKAWAAPPTS